MLSWKLLDFNKVLITHGRIYLRQIRYWSFTRGYCAVPYDNGLGWWTANINVQHLFKQKAKAMTSLSSSTVLATMNRGTFSVIFNLL